MGRSIMNFGKFHKIVPFLMQILGIYIIILGILSVIFGMRLDNLSFFQLHVGRTASIFIGLCMVLIGNGLKARTRLSWYFAIGLIIASLISIVIRYLFSSGIIPV